MLATSEIIQAAAQTNRINRLWPRWREVPLYHATLTTPHPTLPELPIITKREMRAGFPKNFLPERLSLDDLVSRRVVELEYTSGTSEERLPVIMPLGWWNEQEARALRLNHFVARVLEQQPHARRATLTPPACNGLTCPTVWASPAERTLGNTLYLNLARIPFTLDETELQRMAQEALDWQPQFLDLDPVHGLWFALFCERAGLRLPSVQFILCSYEFVSVVHRRILQRVFGVPVFNLYGSTETGHLLMEDESGAMKPSYGTAFLEVMEPDASGIGPLLVTTLSNDYMPLLRYRIGDLVRRHERAYGTDYTVHGRIRDALTAADGRRVTTWQVDQCLRDVGGLAHYQLRQTDAAQFDLRFIADTQGPSAADQATIATRLKALLGVPVKMTAVPLLLPEASGKFRLTHRVTTPDHATMGETTETLHKKQGCKEEANGGTGSVAP